jgi:phosphotransferase system HPr (HPr) family protein
MQTIEVTIKHPDGLHARPATKFVRLAASFPCKIQIADLTKGAMAVNAKSILGILSLGINQGHQIRIEADGKDDSNAVEALRLLIENNFGEGVA